MFCFVIGNKSQVEHAFTKSITPSLSPVYTSGCATVIPLNLLCWFNTHYPNAHFVIEKGSHNQRASSTAGTVATNTNSSTTDIERHTTTIVTRRDNTATSTSDRRMVTTTTSTSDTFRETTSDTVRDNQTTLDSDARSGKGISVGKSYSIATTSAASDSSRSSHTKPSSVSVCN